MNKRNIFIIIIISALIILSGCISEKNNNNNKNEKIEELNIKIQISNNTVNFVLLPVLINDKKNVSEIFEKLEFINSNGSYKIQDSKYGIVLNISFNNDIELNFKRILNNEDYKDYYWSTLSSDERLGFNEVFIFSYQSNINISIKYNVIYGNTSRKSDYSGEIIINNIWVKISGYDMIKSK